MLSVDTVVAVLAIGLALAFDFVNGFQDTANAVATVIYTKALRPRVAMVMSGLLNFLGALLVGTAVAQVITKIINIEYATLPLVVSVLLAAVMWNLFTWYFGLPISSSHCLIGSLFRSRSHRRRFLRSVLARIVKSHLWLAHRACCWLFSRLFQHLVGTEDHEGEGAGR